MFPVTMMESSDDDLFSEDLRKSADGMKCFRSCLQW